MCSRLVYSICCAVSEILTNKQDTLLLFISRFLTLILFYHTHFLGAVDVLCELTRKQDPALRLNGVWGLMNLSFNSEQRIKSQIMTTLGTDQVSFTK